MAEGHRDRSVAQDIAMEIAILRSFRDPKKYAEASQTWMNLIGLMGIEEATELIEQAEEILKMVTPTR